MLMNNVGRLFCGSLVDFSKLRHVYLIPTKQGIAQSSSATAILHARFAYPPDEFLRKPFLIVP